MSIEGILVGLMAIAIGAVFATYGLKAFIILLPLWAFFVGLLAGSSWAAEFLSEGFLGTTTSWIIGLAVGIGLALISYFWYYAAVTIVGGALGYTLGAGLLAAFGLDGFLSVVAGLVVGALFAAVVFLTAVPVFLVILLSAASGAAAIVNGALIFLGRIQLEDLQYGLGQGLYKDGIIAIGAWIVLTVLAFGYQIRDNGKGFVDMSSAEIDRSAYKVG
jgi:hypothetical protein